jgi:SAM-dependent methyltransferase
VWLTEAVDAATVRPLREQVLRPGQSPEQLTYDGDDAPDTLHLAVRSESEIVGVTSVLRDGHPHDPRPGDWRIRGMATRAGMRGRSIGAALLEGCERHARERDGARVWCNARRDARRFYERAGFTVEGDEFEIPSLGAHYLMSKALTSSAPSREARARSFGRVAGEYERGRPGYPQEAIEWLLGAEPIEVLDLGAGTGKLTAALLEAGHSAIAVEPLEEMRSILVARLPSARALAGTAEQLPLPDASVDAVVVGAAFHWFDQQAAAAEIARVLSAPGILGLLGNSFDTSLPWVARVRELLGPPAIERPGHWPTTEELGERFAEVEDREFAHEQLIDAAGLRDLAVSRSSVALMGAVEQGALLRDLDTLWEIQPELRGLTVASLPWRTRVRRARTMR